jgi:glutathione S-transferase
VEVDLDDRPAWIYEKNRKGRVPVLEEDTFLLPESAVINEYLDERYPDPPLWPADAAERSLARLLVFRFDDLSRPYYALRRGEDGAAEAFDEALAWLDALLERRPYLTGSDYGLADIAYIPWIVRAHGRMDVELGRFPSVASWFERLSGRPAVEAELAVVASS